MKKHLVILLPVLLLTLALVVSPAFGSNDKNDNKGKNEDRQDSTEKNNKDKKGNEYEESSKEITVSVTGELSVECDPDGEWKNHGQYVSCVAKQRLGGKATSQAAGSDTGKKTKTTSPTDAHEITPTVTPTITPTIDPSISASPTISASASVTVTTNQVDAIIKVFEKMLNFFKNLL